MTAPETKCPDCERSPSGVCFVHAGAGTKPKDDDPRRCTGVKQDGTRCTRWALQGRDMCKTHDDKRRNTVERTATAAGRTAAQRRLRDAAIRHLKEVGRTVTAVDPLEELETLASEALALKDWFRVRLVEEIDTRKGEDIDMNEFEARLGLYTSALERAANLVTGFGKHGLEKRLVEIREELAQVVGVLFNRLLAEFVPPEMQAGAQALLVETVAAIEAPSREV